MKPNPPAAPAEPVLLFIAAAWRLVAEALAALLLAALALVLTIAGWRPTKPPARPCPGSTAPSGAPPRRSGL